MEEGDEGRRGARKELGWGTAIPPLSSLAREKCQRSRDEDHPPMFERNKQQTNLHSRALPAGKAREGDGLRTGADQTSNGNLDSTWQMASSSRSTPKAKQNSQSQPQISNLSRDHRAQPQGSDRPNLIRSKEAVNAPIGLAFPPPESPPPRSSKSPQPKPRLPVKPTPEVRVRKEVRVREGGANDLSSLAARVKHLVVENQKTGSSKEKKV